MNKALTTGTMNTEVMLLPDFSAPKIEAEKMSPMDSLKAIFEDMRDSLSTLVEQTKDLGPSASDFSGIYDNTAIFTKMLAILNQ